MPKYLLMAPCYHLNNGQIVPDEGEPIRKPYADNDLLFDFIMLLKECAQRQYLYDAEFGVIKRNYSERIKYIIRRKRQARKEIEPLFLAFANTWGLFGIIHDEAVFDYQKTDFNGVTITRGGSPAYAIRIVTDPEGFVSYKRIAYDVYAKRFFPNMEDKMPFRPITKQFIANYCENIDDILENPRFDSCVEYIRSIDKKNKRTFDLKNVDLKVTIQNISRQDRFGNIVLHPERSAEKRVPLIKLCQILLFDNETQEKKDKAIGICHYKRCHKPYRIAERECPSIYCSEKCMRNANKGAIRE